MRDLAGGDLPTVLFDATGNVRSMTRAFPFLGHAGKLVFVGIVPDDISFADPLFHRREMTILASRNALPRHFRRIIGLIEQGRLDTRPWITHCCPFEALPERFAGYTRPETGVVKAMVEIG